MPYDPNFPADNVLIESLPFRDQFHGLKDLIDAIQAITAAQIDAVNTLPPGNPAAVTVSASGGMLHFTFGIPQGSEGPQGITGPPFASAVVDSVTTLPPGNNAAVNVFFDGSNVHFTFAIPQGQEGPQGITGPPFASAVVDSVTTLPPGTNAAVNVFFDGSNVHFTFAIPQGQDGPQGIQGYQGPPGEVTLSQLDNAISGVLNVSSNNSNGVNTLNQPADANYNQTQMQDVLSKLDELILALRR